MNELPTNSHSLTALPDVTVLIFSCTGRAHLLKKTLVSFHQQCPFVFAETIYAHDGEMDPAAPGWVGANRLVQNCVRRGYVQSIMQALALVRTPYFFWLEDDWEFNEPVDLVRFRDAMETHNKWLQIRLSKVAPLPDFEQAALLEAPGLHRSGCAFSANPHLGRTEQLRAGFLSYYASPRTPANTFENFLETWVAQTQLVCVVLAPDGSLPSIQHTGYLESTGRQWHAAAAFDSVPATYSSGLHGVGGVCAPLWRRVVLASRLVLTATQVAVRAFYRRSAYDLAFRFISLSRQRDE